MPRGFYDHPACDIRAGCLTEEERQHELELQEQAASDNADQQPTKGQQVTELNNLPASDVRIIAADDIAERLLIHAGILDEVTSMANSIYKTEFDTTMMKFTLHEAQEVWRCLACYHWNQPVESENGFVIIMLKQSDDYDADKFLDAHIERLNSSASLKINFPKNKEDN
jgi:hypothetical protein